MDDRSLLATYKRKAEIAERQVASVQELLDRRREWDDPSKRTLSINDVQTALTGSP